MNEISSTQSSAGGPGVPVERGAQEFRFQASFGQERLWVLEHLRADVPLYMHSFALRCEGPLDVEALRGAVAVVVDRHETLRTRFDIEDGRLMQIISSSLEVDIPLTDLTHLGPDGAEAEARRLAEGLDDEPVDLSVAPLVRFRLLRVAPEDHVLVVAIHHAVSDGWSIGILLRELAEAYGALVEGRTPSLPELPVQFADYATWQREWLSGDELARQVAHWRDVLEGAPALLELPTDRPRPPVQSFDGAATPVAVPAKTLEAVNALAQDERATTFMTVAAAAVALLHRYARQPEVMLATPVAGRRRSEIEPLIGFFVNTLVLRTDCSDNPTFRQLVRRVRDVALDAYAHQDLPFEKLVEELNPDRDLSHLPLAQVMLVLQTAPGEGVSLRDVDVTPYPLAEDMAPYDLTIELKEDGGGLTGSFLYNTDLFDEATIEQLARHLERFLAAAARDPAARVDDVPLLDDDELRASALRWVEHRPELTGPPLLHELLEQRALADPARVALEHAGTEVTYGEVDRLAKGLAARLGASGIGRDDKVGVYFDKGVELIVALLGVLHSGAAFVALEPDGPAERLKLILDDLRPGLILTGGRERERIDTAVAELTSPPEVWTLDEAALLSAEPGPAPEIGVRDLAYVVYTSGSTGVPKGVMIEQSGVVGMVRSMAERYRITPDARFLQFMSIGFDASFSEIFPTLLAGGTLVLRDRAAMMPGPGLVELLEHDRITHLLTTPSALGVMRPAELPDLRTLIVCGEACSADLAARWGPSRHFVNAYGPTEVTVCTHTCNVSGDGRPPIGFGLANTESYVLDPRLNESPVLVKGELYIGSPGVARGYLDRPSLTAAAFVPNPWGPAGSRMYRTGDLVRRRRDGQLDFLGRVDDQAKVRGFRIEPGEIESALALHDGVADVVVVTDRDPGGATRLVCYFTVDGEDLSAEDLRDFLATRLPSYMIPAAFVRLDEMPRSLSGKLDRKALASQSLKRVYTATAYVAPATATEKETARVWCDVLGLDRVGVRDKFFEVGGNSLKIVELFERLDALYPGALSVAELFEHPTVTAMAAVIESRSAADVPAPSLAGFEL